MVSASINIVAAEANMASQQDTNRTRHLHHRHHGLALVPPPSRDPQDPLRWPLWQKQVALFAAALTNFTSNFAGAGLSVATVLLEMEFHKTPDQINTLLTFNFLTLGIGNMLWVPLACKFGKRSTLLLAYGALFAILIWTSKEKTFNGLLAARCLSGFVSAAGESIVPGIVADIFFLHERATAMSVYTILITSGTAVGPLLASFIVQYSPGTWRDYVWVCAALAGSNAVLLFLCYPETNFDREFVEEMTEVIPADAQSTVGEEPKGCGSLQIEDMRTDVEVFHPTPKPWTEIWLRILTIDPSTSFWRSLVRPIFLIACPDVLLAVFVYGAALAAQIILIFAFPTLLMAPPYLFTSIGVGLMQIPAIIGFLIATFLGGYIADVITARVVRRHGGHFEPAQRLVALLPAFWVAPVGCIIVAFACSQRLHWISIAFGFGMLSFGTLFAPNIVVTSTVESHQRSPEEALVVINVCKNLVAFLFLYEAVNWVESQGYLQVYIVMFFLSTFGVILAGLAYRFRATILTVNGKISRWL